MTTRLDALVIGSGQAAPALAVKLAGAGLQLALVERRRLGGTCVNDGCTPTKALIACARAAFVARRAADWGVRVDGDVTVDLRAVKARVDAVVAQSVTSLTAWLEGTPGLRLVHGHARFTGPHTIDVAGETFEAPKIFIDVGGRATLPPWPGIDTVPVLTNTTVLDLDTLPAHLLIAGASYIGLEFAQAYRRFGARVTVVDVAERPVAREAAEVSGTLQAILEREGVRFVLGAKDVRVERTTDLGDGIRLHATVNGAPVTLDASHLLAAVGRRPNTDDLGLDRAGIATDARGYITVDEQLRTHVDGVWALGDANGRGAFTHTAYNDHEIVAANLFGGDDDTRHVSERIAAYALYTDPPLARIGLDVAQARALPADRALQIATLPMKRVARARERGETDGFMQVIVDARSERILGATLLGIEADEVIHTLLAVMSAGASYRVLQRGMPIHPTVSELLPTLLEGLRPLDRAAAG